MLVISNQRGTSLIEVMMAVLVFSIGLIGLAGLMVMASRSSHAAYLRTQVTFLASNMANRMSANSTGVWKGDYNSDNYPLGATEDRCAEGAACNSAALAAHDQKLWSSQLKTFLPDPSATVQCSVAAIGGINPAPDLSRKPPYGGNCMMTISWNEQGAGDQNHRGNGVQTFAWSFQP
jgi:type IV pilus assembly protein PilV